jgi:hypothetical protein
MLRASCTPSSELRSLVLLPPNTLEKLFKEEKIYFSLWFQSMVAWPMHQDRTSWLEAMGVGEVVHLMVAKKQTEGEGREA